MSKFRPGKLTAPPSMMLTRELAFAADRSLRAGNQIECIAIIARIYALFDALEMGCEPEPDEHSYNCVAEQICLDNV